MGSAIKNNSGCFIKAVADREVSVEVPPNKQQVVITNDGKGGLRVVV